MRDQLVLVGVGVAVVGAFLTLGLQPSELPETPSAPPEAAPEPVELEEASVEDAVRADEPAPPAESAAGDEPKPGPRARHAASIRALVDRREFMLALMATVKAERPDQYEVSVALAEQLYETFVTMAAYAHAAHDRVSAAERSDKGASTAQMSLQVGRHALVGALPNIADAINSGAIEVRVTRYGYAGESLSMGGPQPGAGHIDTCLSAKGWTLRLRIFERAVPAAVWEAAMNYGVSSRERRREEREARRK